MSKAVFSLEPALELELEISETRFGLLPEDLFRLAVRQNTQRAFLFVSKVLGKHLPVEPAALLSLPGNPLSDRTLQSARALALQRDR